MLADDSQQAPQRSEERYERAAGRRVRPYRRLLAATGAGLAVAGVVAGTYILIADGLRARPTPAPTVPAVAAEGLTPDASDDPAVTVLQPTMSPAPVPPPAAAPHHSATPSAPSASRTARSLLSRSAESVGSQASSSDFPSSSASLPAAPAASPSGMGPH